MENKPVGLIDMDGTIADFEGSMLAELKLIASPDESDELLQAYIHRTIPCPDYMERRKDLIMSRGEWWENIPRFLLGFEVMEAMEDIGFYLSILTQGPKENPTAWSNKVRWCLKHIPSVDITMTRKKALVYGKVLVDDYPKYVDSWLEWRPRGLVIMPANSGNVDYSHPQVVRYDGSNFPEVRSRLENAYEEAMAKLSEGEEG
jgi:5'(3')-deoxyribonucleotidase